MGAESLILGVKQKLDIKSQELGNDKPVLDAMAAAAHRDAQMEVALSGRLSGEDRRNAEDLVKAGAQLRYLSRRYFPAIPIIAEDRAFLGSRNISVSSLDRNKEVGTLITWSPVNQAVQWFVGNCSMAR